ncbi:PH domain-containing protein [Deinococcus malanensis]|nr:PH domain-containing protein [Deinococcus malanensis]
MESVTIGLILLTLPPLLYIVSRKSGVRYTWAPEALRVEAGLRRYVFPYATTSARFTTQPLGSRIWGTAVSGSVTGRYTLNSSTVHALATTTRPAQALLLTAGQHTFYVTPEKAEEFADRFLAK